MTSPNTIVLDLPYPPSVNAMWRTLRGRNILSREVRVWWTLAEGLFYQQKRGTAAHRIAGAFEVEIVLDRKRRRTGDLDNRIKAPLDAAQKFGLIENDRFCERIVAYWGDADGGCRVTLRECAG